MAKKFLTGLNLVVLNADPATGSEGELYFNSSASVAKIYQAGAWSVLGAGGGGGAITVSTTEPASPETGDAWYKNDTGEFYVYDGTYWVEVNGVIEGLSQEQVQDYVAPLFTSSTNSNVISTYDDVNNVINLNTSGSLVSIDSITYPDYIVFDTTPETSSASVGTLSWDSGESSLSVQLDGELNVGIGQEIIVLCNNGEATTLNKGEVVRLSGASGQRPQVTRAYNLNDTGSALTIGIVAENIAAGAEGFVVTQGIVKNINTNAFNEGDILYLSASAGILTTIKPQAPNHYVFVGVVLKKNAASGRIYVKPQNGYELDELHNVLISASVQNNELLAYDLPSGLWINQTADEAGVSLSSHNHTLDSLSNVEINSLNNGEAIVWNSASAAWVNQLIVSGEGGGGATTTVSETAPVSPTLGDTWYRQSDGSFFIYDGSYWVEVNGIIDGLTEDQVQDYASTLFTHANHSNITATYNDTTGQIILTSSAAQDLTPYLTQSSASSIYLTQVNASTIYATQVDLDNIDLSPYLTQSSASTTYLTQVSASTTYATQAALNSINGESDQFILPSQIFG
jgi:hypothetical protein